MKSKWIKRVIFLLVIAVAFYFVYKEQTKPMPVEYTKLKIQNYDENLIASGIVTADEYVDINPKVSSQITNLNVKLGSYVKAGQTLAILDSQTSRRDIRSKEAAVEISKTNLDSLETSKKLASENLDKLNLQLKNLQDDLSKKEDLYKNEVIPKVELEDAQQKVDEKVIEINSAKITLDSYEKNGTETNKAKENLNQANVQLENAKQNLSDYTVISPVSGIVTKLNQNMGEIADPSKTMMQIAKGGQKVVKIDVDENYINDVKIGQDVKIYRQNDEKNKVSSKIDFISPKVDKDTGTVEVKSYINPKDRDKFLYDSDVTVSFLAKSYKDALVLDTKYITVKDDKKYVYIFKDGKAKLTNIKTRGFGKNVMVTSGIDKNDIILNPENLKDEKSVSISKQDKEG